MIKAYLKETQNEIIHKKKNRFYIARANLYSEKRRLTRSVSLRYSPYRFFSFRVCSRKLGNV